jgi:hypothetical protein
MNSKLTNVILVVSIIALALSFFNTFTIYKFQKEQAKSIAEMKAVVDQVTPIVPQLETISKALPQLQQLLLSIPPEPKK